MRLSLTTTSAAALALTFAVSPAVAATAHLASRSHADSHNGDSWPPTGGLPEPAAWSLMIAGFGLAGAALRRRPHLQLS